MLQIYKLGFCRVAFYLMIMPVSIFSTYSFANVTMQDVIQMAIQNAPWLTSNQLQERAIRAASDGVDNLPDSQLSFGMLNFPTDGFALNQEPMTQIKVGIAQTFPRGNSLKIKQQQLRYQAEQHPYRREDYKAKLRVTVSQHWLDAISAQRTIELIERDRKLFEQLSHIVQANYASALGGTRQQDVLKAQLELARLDDRLISVHNQRDIALNTLSEWLSVSEQQQVRKALIHHQSQSTTEPRLVNKAEDMLQRTDMIGLSQLLTHHPALLAIEQVVNAKNTNVKLAEQNYKPLWGVNVSYAYRDDDFNGQSRADFFSIGLTLDVPIFGHAQQDSDVVASRLMAQAVETDKRLLQKSMVTEMLNLYQQKIRLSQRELGFHSIMLPQFQQQADASLSAYTSNNGPFNEVVRARIEQLDVQIEFIELQIKKLKIDHQIMYFLSGIPSLLNTGEHR